MGVSDANAVYGSNARFTHKPISFYLETIAVSQTALEVYEHVPGYHFEIVGFEVYAVSVTATVTFDLKIGTTSVLSAVLTPVAATAAKATIKTDGSEYGDADDVITIQGTTNGTGDATAAQFQIWIRRRAASIS